MNRRFKEIVFGLLFFALLLPSPGYPLSYADSGCTYDGDGTESFCAPGAGQPGAFNNLSSVQTFLTGDQSGNVLALKGDSVFRELFAATNAQGRDVLGGKGVSTALVPTSSEQCTRPYNTFTGLYEHYEVEGPPVDYRWNRECGAGIHVKTDFFESQLRGAP